METNNKLNRLEAYSKSPAYGRARNTILNYAAPKSNNIKHILDLLLFRHEYLTKIEGFIADHPVLLQYFSQAEDDILKSKEPYSIITLFIKALEKMSNTLLEYEKGYDSMSEFELMDQIGKLEEENKELRSKLDKIEKVLG